MVVQILNLFRKKDRWLSKVGHKFYEDLLVPYKIPKLDFRDEFLEFDDEVPSQGEQEKPSESVPGAPTQSGGTLETT
jgi:hypothetical protein